MFQILNSVGWREAGDCAALSVVTAVLFPTWSPAQGNHQWVPAGWGCISARITAWRALSWLVDRQGHPQKVISPVCSASHALGMLFLFGLQKWPMGNITAAIQILEQILSLHRDCGVGRIGHFELVLIPTKQHHTDCEHAIKHCTACLDMVGQYLLALFFLVLVVPLLSLQFFPVASLRLNGECLHLPMGDTGLVTISWAHFPHASGGKHEAVTRIICFLPHLLNTGY